MTENLVVGPAWKKSLVKDWSACLMVLLVATTSSENALNNDNGDSRMDAIWVEALWLIQV